MPYLGFLLRLAAALLLHAIANKSLLLTSLTSEDMEDTSKLKVSALIKGLGRQDQTFEELVARLSLEAGVPRPVGPCALLCLNKLPRW